MAAAAALVLFLSFLFGRAEAARPPARSAPVSAPGYIDESTGWYLNGNKISTVSQGTLVEATAYLVSEPSGNYQIEIRRDRSGPFGLPDETAGICSFTHPGGSRGYSCSFVPDVATGQDDTRGYFFKVKRKGFLGIWTDVWEMVDSYPPRLAVAGQISSVSWRDSSCSRVLNQVEEGTRVCLYVVGTGYSGQTLGANVYESDLLGASLTYVTTVPVSFSGNVATGFWTSTWRDDGLGEGDPEYRLEIEGFVSDELTVARPSLQRIVRAQGDAGGCSSTIDFYAFLGGAPDLSQGSNSEEQLDPINLIFCGLAASMIDDVLRGVGWQATGSSSALCPSSTHYVYDRYGRPVRVALDLDYDPSGACAFKPHARLYILSDAPGNRWIIASAHVDGVYLGHPVTSWDEAEDRVRNIFEAAGYQVSERRLGNNDGLGAWRGIPYDGVATFISLPPAGSTATPVPAFAGTAPSAGGVGLLVTSAESNASGLVDALAASGCRAQALAVLVGGGWSVFIAGAPPAVNAPFPEMLAPNSPFFVRCR